MTLFVLLLFNYIMDAFLCRKWVVYDFGVLSEGEEPCETDEFVANFVSFTPVINSFFVVVWFGFLVSKSLTFEKK